MQTSFKSILCGFAGSLLLVATSARADSWTAPDGTVYPYCTTSGDNGGGFGWQPELGGPNGGSCKIWENSGSSNNSSGFPSGTWYDGNGVAYPYCTTSGDNGGGFGWQPDLGGPNGGSCKINYNNGGNNNGGNNSGNNGSGCYNCGGGGGGGDLIWVNLGGGQWGWRHRGWNNGGNGGGGWNNGGNGNHGGGGNGGGGWNNGGNGNHGGGGNGGGGWNNGGHGGGGSNNGGRGNGGGGWNNGGNGGGRGNGGGGRGGRRLDPEGLETDVSTESL